MTPTEREHLRLLRQIRTCTAIIAAVACVGLVLFLWPDLHHWFLTHRITIAITMLFVVGILLLPLAAWGLDAVVRRTSHRDEG